MLRKQPSCWLSLRNMKLWKQGQPPHPPLRRRVFSWMTLEGLLRGRAPLCSSFSLFHNPFFYFRTSLYDQPFPSGAELQQWDRNQILGHLGWGVVVRINSKKYRVTERLPFKISFDTKWENKQDFLNTDPCPSPMYPANQGRTKLCGRRAQREGWPRERYFSS